MVCLHVIVVTMLLTACRWNAREDVAKKKAAQVKEGASKEVILTGTTL